MSESTIEHYVSRAPFDPRSIEARLPYSVLGFFHRGDRDDIAERRRRFLRAFGLPPNAAPLMAYTHDPPDGVLLTLDS